METSGFAGLLKTDVADLQKTTDDRLLNTKWRMLAAGKLMSERHAVSRSAMTCSTIWRTIAAS
jgi:hypothetical protein